jgi:hypothetical protein
MLVAGLPGAPGGAIGPVWRFRPASTGVAPGPVGDEAATLSADPNSLDGIREAIGGASAVELRGLAANALEAEDAAAVRQMARPLLERAAVA